MSARCCGVRHLAANTLLLLAAHACLSVTVSPRGDPWPGTPHATNEIESIAQDCAVRVAEVVHSRSKWQHNYTAPHKSVANGVFSYGNMLRLRRVASDLLMGKNVTVAVAGGSISKGWGDNGAADTLSKGYFGRFWQWLRGAFDGHDQVITNKGGAIGAVMSPMYAACTHHIIKDSADLVFVEFVQNDLYRAGGQALERDARRKAFERLVRNLLRYPRAPAVVVYMAYPHSSSFWRTAENDMLVIAQYYQLPIISVRSAFFKHMAQGDPGFDLTGLYTSSDRASTRNFFNSDYVHPWAQSYTFMADLAIFLVQTALKSVAASPVTEEIKVALERGFDVPHPMFPGNDGSGANVCILNEALWRAPVHDAPDRFVWFDEGRGKWGWWSNATTPGASITLELDTSGANSSAEAAGNRVMLAIGCLHSGTKPMGVARITCEAGCECEPREIDAKWDHNVSLTSIDTLRVTRHPRCRVRIQVVERTSTGGHWFKVSVMMVLDYVSDRTSAQELFGGLPSLSTVERMTKTSASLYSPSPGHVRAERPAVSVPVRHL